MEHNDDNVQVSVGSSPSDSGRDATTNPTQAQSQTEIENTTRSGLADGAGHSAMEVEHAIQYTNTLHVAHSDVEADHADPQFAYDLPLLDSYGFETGINEATTLHYTDFLKDLLNCDGHADAAQPVPYGEFLESNNLWDQYLSEEPRFEDLRDLSLPNLLHTTGHLDRAAQARDSPIPSAQSHTTIEERACVAGARAFEQSGWNWTPTSASQPSDEQSQANLMLPQGWTSEMLQPDPSLAHKPLTVNDRNRVLSMLLAFCGKKHVVQIATTFPPVQALEGMLHTALRHQLADTLSWIHVPTLDPENMRDELLAAAIAYGASLTNIDLIQKLGHAMTDILRFAVTERVGLIHFSSHEPRLMRILVAPRH